MEGTITQTVKTQTNSCTQCKMATYCFPALLDKQTLNDARYLHFNARALEPGEHLCRQGSVTGTLFFMRSGMLKSYYNKEDGEEYVMDFHFPPELFGWEGIDIKQSSFSIVALDYSNVCEIPIEHFKKLLAQQPLLQQQFIQMISQRIRNDNQKQLRTTAEQRISYFILQLANHYKQLGFPYNMCKLVMTHQDIANYLRLAPATVRRILHQMKSRNVLSIQRKKIYINNMDELTHLSKGLISKPDE